MKIKLHRKLNVDVEPIDLITQLRYKWRIIKSTTMCLPVAYQMLFINTITDIVVYQTCFKISELSFPRM